MEAKAMIKKPFAKICYTELIRWYYHGRTGSRPPIGVTMIQVSQVPKWFVAYMPDQEAWQWFGFDHAPKWFCGLRKTKRRDWFRLDHVPKWSGGCRLSKGVALVRTRPRPPVIYKKQMSRGKPEAALNRTTPCNLAWWERQRPRFSWGSGLIYQR